MPLTDTVIRSLKPQPKPYKKSDSEGLHIYVTPTGTRLWRQAYRYGGRQKQLSHGAYPEISLKDARDLARDAKRLLGEGRDPALVKKSKKLETASGDNTFKAVAEAYLEACKTKWVPDYLERQRARLAADIYPHIGSFPVNLIEPSMMITVLKRVEARGVVETARRLKTLCSQVFRYAKADGKCTIDPTSDIGDALAPVPKVKHRAKVEEGAHGELFSRIHHYQHDPRTRLGLLLTLHTLVRTDELRFADVREFRLDGDEPLWRIPAERMKLDREHLVPLSRQALDLVREAKSFMLPRSTLLFGALTRSKVISENTMLYALYRLGYHKRQTVHGFRSIGSTVLNESGHFHGDWIERQLAHDDDDKIRGTYNAAQYLAGRRSMMVWWSDYIDEKRAEYDCDESVRDLLG